VPQATYLDAGIYTIRDAVRLTGASEGQIRGWARGHPGSRAKPLLLAEYEQLGWRIPLSFKNIFETILIKAFSDFGISIQGIRAMAEEAREMLGDDHPFTRVKFKTDGQKIFAEMLNTSSKQKELYDLRTRNWAIERVMRQFLKAPVKYNADGYANVWYPRKKIAPHVVITPTKAFGQPVLEDSGVPTETLVDAIEAEGGNYARVARWYVVPVDQVREAKRFEAHLAKH
jgi:uncharacterized protein (DUF433 family)